MPVNFDFNDLYAFRALMEYGAFGWYQNPFACHNRPSAAASKSWKPRWATGCSSAPPAA